LLTAQSILDIAYPFRRLIQYENRISMKLGRFVQVLVKDPQPSGQVFGKRLWYLSDWVFKIYRTEFKVKPPEYLGLHGVDEDEHFSLADYLLYEKEIGIIKNIDYNVVNRSWSN